MWNPTTALLWEQWRRTRWAVATAILVVLGMGTLHWLIDDLRAFMGPGEAAMVATAYSMIGLVAWLLFNLSGTRDLSFGYSALHRTLPIGSRHLAFVVIGFKLAVFASTLGILTLISIWPFKARIYDWDQWILLTIVFAYLLSVGWLFGARRIEYGFIAALLLAGPSLWIGVLASALPIPPVGTLFLFLAMCVVGAFAGAVRNRHEPDALIRFNGEVIKRTEAAPNVSPLSPKQAQAWFERSTRVRLFLGVVSVFYLAYGLWVLLPSIVVLGYIDSETVLSLTVHFMPGAAMFCAVLVGFGLIMRDRREADSTQGNFLYTHPINLAEHAEARVEASMFSALLVTALLFVPIALTGVGVSVFGTNELARSFWNALEYSSGIPWWMTPVVVFLAVWLLLTNGWLVVTQVLLAILFAAFVSTLPLNPDRVDSLAEYGVFTILAVTTIVVSLYLLTRSVKLGCLSRRSIWYALFLATTLFVIAFRIGWVSYVSENPQYLNPTEVTLIVCGSLAVSLLPVISIAQQGPWIHWLRHR